MLFCVQSSAPLVRGMERSSYLVVLFCPNYDFLLRCTFRTCRLEGMLCVHVQCHDEGILFTVG